ncbi:hypothetical protein CesoFtcFv8_013663 [Champsocephalus esox]|uniref:Uncharacterized protein n=1 Tax=Champsocephalus esox TaxID=159716 RepID=A0AAN8BS00_9TELE|nr:hypothetical protein CesoFtcFv8_013663 [Champsocephalus esox]
MLSGGSWCSSVRFVAHTARAFCSPVLSVHGGDKHYYAERRTVLSVTLLLAFFSHPHPLSSRGGARVIVWL